MEIKRIEFRLIDRNFRSLVNVIWDWIICTNEAMAWIIPFNKDGGRSRCCLKRINFRLRETRLTFTDGAFNCPNKDGQYEDPKQCDKYYGCTDGLAKEKLCPDGLVFDPLIRKVNKCDHVFNVDCGDRLELRKLIITVVEIIFGKPDLAWNRGQVG